MENSDVSLFSYPIIDSEGGFGYNIVFSYKF